MTEQKVAALFVRPGGPYYGLPKVEPWGPDVDARNYRGPYPVVAHPPCARWGRYWSGGPSSRERLKLGDDGGCFESALESVCRWGGVLEHPEASHAWRAYEIARPPRGGGWVPAGLYRPGWTCCVEQGHYGHRARKATWLYYVGACKPWDFIWGPSEASVRLDDGFHSKEERARSSVGVMPRLLQKEAEVTPDEFRDELLLLARFSVVPDKGIDEPWVPWLM